MGALRRLEITAVISKWVRSSNVRDEQLKHDTSFVGLRAGGLVCSRPASNVFSRTEVIQEPKLSATTV